MNKFLGLLALAISFSAAAQNTSLKPDYSFLNAIASCSTVDCLRGQEKQVHGNVEGTVLYAKWLLLDPSSATATRGILEHVPKTEAEASNLMTIADWHEGATTSAEQMKRLDAIHEKWPQLLALSVQRFPGYLPAYIHYGRLATIDMHSDYTGFEREVCKREPRRFFDAFQLLSAEDRQYIRTYVFEPSGCKPIFVSEAN